MRSGVNALALTGTMAAGSAVTVLSTHSLTEHRHGYDGFEVARRQPPNASLHKTVAAARSQGCRMRVSGGDIK